MTVRRSAAAAFIFLMGGLTITVFFLFSPVPSPKIEHFILISLDDLRADRLGCYGNERDVSPVIDDLARNGFQCGLAFTPFPFTPPSHTAMLSSLYPEVFDLPLDPKIETLAGVLTRNGYETAAFTGGGFMSSNYGVLNGFSHGDDTAYSLPTLLKRADDWLEENHKNRFFLFLHTYYMHVPFEAPEKYFQKYADPDYDGPVENNRASTAKFIRQANQKTAKIEKADIQRIFDIYDAQIPVVDGFISDIIKTLERLGIRDNTMLIITSDHGEQFYEYGFFGHTSSAHYTADVSTRVPLIISCPVLKHHRRIDDFIELIDMPPTVLQAAGINPHHYFQGKSFFPSLSRKTTFLISKKKYAFFCLNDFTGIRTERYKLGLNQKSGDISLYDLKDDPGEKNNLSGEAAYNTTIKKLLESLENIQKNNRRVRAALNLEEVRLVGVNPDQPPVPDEETAFLFSCEAPSFYSRADGRTAETYIDNTAITFVRGRFKRGINLEPDGLVLEPNTNLLGRTGSLEFTIKFDRDIPNHTDAAALSFQDGESELSITIQHIWDRRYALEMKKITAGHHEIGEKMTFVIPGGNRWSHVIISWEDENIFFHVNGNLTSWKKSTEKNFFYQESTSRIVLRGEKCGLDELRVSRDSRVVRTRVKEEISLSEDIKKRLKALGYLK